MVVGTAVDIESARVQARESERASEEHSFLDISGRRQHGAATFVHVRHNHSSEPLSRAAASSSPTQHK